MWKSPVRPQISAAQRAIYSLCVRFDHLASEHFDSTYIKQKRNLKQLMNTSKPLCSCQVWSLSISSIEAVWYLLPTKPVDAKHYWLSRILLTLLLLHLPMQWAQCHVQFISTCLHSKSVEQSNTSWRCNVCWGELNRWWIQCLLLSDSKSAGVLACSTTQRLSERSSVRRRNDGFEQWTNILILTYIIELIGQDGRNAFNFYGTKLCQERFPRCSFAECISKAKSNTCCHSRPVVRMDHYTHIRSALQMCRVTEGN